MTMAVVPVYASERVERDEKEGNGYDRANGPSS